MCLPDRRHTVAHWTIETPCGHPFVTQGILTSKYHESPTTPLQLHRRKEGIVPIGAVYRYFPHSLTLVVEA